MRSILAVCLLCIISLPLGAQSKSSGAKAIHKPTVAERLDKLESSLQATVKSRDDLQADNERLKAANKELSDSNIALAAKYEELRKSAFEALQFGKLAAGEYEKANTTNGELINKYNTLLNQANSIISQQNAHLAQQARISNALAIYGMMPRATYTPLQMPPTPSPNINCTSSNIGTTTYTNCH